MSNALCKIRKSSYIKDFAYYIDSPSAGLKRLNEYKRAYKKGSTNRYRSNPLKGRRG